MRQVYNGLSILLIGLFGYAVIAVTISYHYEALPQGGWNSYRITEFGLNIAPFLLVFFSLVTTRLSNCPSWLFLAATTMLLFSSAYIILRAAKQALTMTTAAWIPAIVFFVLLAAHVRFIGTLDKS